MKKKNDKTVGEKNIAAAAEPGAMSAAAGAAEEQLRHRAPSGGDSKCATPVKDAMAAGDAGTPPGPDTVQVGRAEFEALKQKAQEAESWLNALKRAKADFDNYQKRVERDKEETRKYVAESVLCDILPIVDNLERAISASATAKDLASVLAGLKAIHQELLRTLEKHSVTPIESCGKPFDPACHEAVCCEESADCPDSTVTAELGKGYKLHDRVLRPAQVKVSKRKAQSTEQEPDKDT